MTVFWLRRCRRAAGLVFAICLLVPATASATTATATSVVVSPDGTRVYVGFNGVGFSVFGRDSSTGRLSVLGEAPGAPTGGGLFDPSLAVSPDGANVYGVDGQGNRLLQYAPCEWRGRHPAVRSGPRRYDRGQGSDHASRLTRWLERLRAHVWRAVRKQRSRLGRQDHGLPARSEYGNPLVQTTPLDTSANFGGAVGTDAVMSPDGRFIYVSS